MLTRQTRRQFLTTAALAGVAGLIGAPRAFAAEGVLETTTVRMPYSSSICIAPQEIADEFMRAEGLTDFRLVPDNFGNQQETLARGEFDFVLDYGLRHISAIDGGLAITILTGVHVGCFELFARESIRSITDLKGKSVGVTVLGSPMHVFLALMAAQVGLDPSKDVNWVVNPTVKPKELFIAGKIDAFMGFPPEAQELRARRIGHVIVNSATDRPWSHYFCCMLAGNREFVRKYPIATKRVMRAILKAADLCSAKPARAARLLVDGGFTKEYDYALQTLGELPYDKWREYDPEDTIRFYALRLHETGFINASPQKIIADGTNWRFLDELKRELKT